MRVAAVSAGSHGRQPSAHLGSRTSSRSDVYVFVLFVVLTVVLTWPLTRYAAVRVPFSLADPNHLGWLLSWQLHALVTEPLQMFQSPIFFPFANSLALSEQLIGGAIFALPAWLLTHNATLVFNTVLLVTFPIGAFGAYLLVRDVTRWRMAGVVAGVAFAFGAYQMARPTHIHVYLVMWTPYVLLFLRRFLLTRSWRHALGVAATVWLQLISSMHGFLILLVILPVAALVLLLRDRDVVRDRRFWVRGAVAGVTVIVAALPFVIPYMRILEENPQFERTADEVALYSPGKRGLLSAPYSSRLYGRVIDALGEHPYAYEKRLFPGFGLLAFAGLGAAVGLRSRDRHLRSWTLAFAAVAAVAALMSLGTTPTRGGVFGTAQRFIPGLEVIRTPGRFATAITLALAGLAGIALTSIRGRGLPSQRAALACAVLTLLLVDSLHEPWNLVENYRIPPVYSWVAEQPSHEPILELPTGEPFTPDEVASWTFRREAPFLLFQTQHWRPLLNGYSSTVPPTYIEMVGAVQGFPDQASLDYLRGLGVRHVIVHRNMVGGTPWQNVELVILQRNPTAVVRDEGEQFVVDISRL